MRRISIVVTSLITSLAMALSGLVFSPANASAPADGTYACGDGTYTITTVESVTTFSDAGTCTGDLVIPEGVTTTSQYVFGFGNSQVTSVSLPESLTQIGFSAFYGTGLLTEINVASNNLAFASVGGVLFRLNEASASLFAYPGNKIETDGTYTTPTSVSFAGGNLIPVTRIETYALQGAKNLTTLNISQGVTTLGYGIAETATLLSTINLPDSYTAMTDMPLAGASGLTALTIGELLTSIQEGSLSSTYNLNSITVHPDNSSYSSLDGVLFNDALTVLIAYPAGKPVASYTIPSGVTTVDKKSFQSASKLTSVIFPSSISAIESEAFSCASYLTSFTFRGDAPTVGEFAFGCIEAPKAYIKSGNNTFTLDADGKWNLLTVSEFDYFANFDSKGGSAVSIGTFLTGGIVSEPTVPTRTGYGFTGWSITDSVADGGTAVAFPYAPSGDITLFANWFEDGNFLCSGARAEVDDTNVYNITGGVVSNGGACTGDVVIPDGATHIGSASFANSLVTSISLPDSLIEIGTQAFLGTGLTAITIPKNVSTMGVGVFQNAFALTSITVAEPNVNYTSSSDGVLFNEALTKLIAYPLGKTATSYTIPSSVDIIGDRAFMSATLTSVIIPSGVGTVEDLAFFCASSLTSIYFLGNAPGTIGNSSFGCLSSGAKAHVKNANLSSFTLVDGKWNDLTVEIVDPPTTYVVTYNYNSATGGNTVASSSFAAGDTPITLPTPTRTGYTFAGWYTNAGLTTKIGNAGANYPPTGTTYELGAYAKWTRNVKAKATVNPTVSGTAKVGKTLTAKNGTWTGSPTPSVTRQWYACKTAVTAARSTIPSNCSKISGATKITFKLASAQKGKWVTVLVTGTSTGTTKTSWLAISTGKVG